MNILGRLAWSSAARVVAPAFAAFVADRADVSLTQPHLVGDRAVAGSDRVVVRTALERNGFAHFY